MYVNLRILATTILLVLGGGSKSYALTFDSGETQVSLIEMFSSQGCSNCPAAEAWISTLKAHEDLWTRFVPVAFHVDYWDYLGWSDPFASIKHSQRQRRYQLHGRCKAVYTPGFMVAGQEWTGWFTDPRLPLMPSQTVGRLKVHIDADSVHVRFLRSADNRGLLLNIALLGFDIVTDIEAGENQGRQLPQDFVVLSLETHSSVDGMWNVKMPNLQDAGDAPKSRRAVAFWVSHGSDPSPIQATGGWLN